MKLFESYMLGKTELKNRIVMAPMTRCRAIGNIPNALMAEYYEQRSGAGLIITEGVSPSPNGLGYARQPGIFNEEQVIGWEKIARAVHARGGKIFVQLMHTGRMSHPMNLPAGARMLAPSAIPVPGGKMYTDQAGIQEIPVPEAMSEGDILHAKKEFIEAAENAVRAGIDGIELHGANGYLLEQFISPVTNQRTDDYGGTVGNRCRFVLEVAKGISAAIGNEKTAIRFSPYGVNGGMQPYPEMHETYQYLASKLQEMGLVYIHLVDHSSMGAPAVPFAVKQLIRNSFRNTLLLSGGYDADRAETDLQSGLADLIAFGKPFIAHPDLADRMRNGYPLNNTLRTAAFYTPDAAGYTDYPAYSPS